VGGLNMAKGVLEPVINFWERGIGA
jgi:hypothetical protein